jgi:Ca-activated chloride channel homolog
MQFAQSLWLVAGAAACAVLVWQYRRFDLAQRAALAQFAAARLLDRLASSVSPQRRAVKRVLFATGIALIFVALARPQAGFEWQETHRRGLEIVFAVDTSKSMLAQDVKPDRLTRAKLGVTDLVGKLNGDGMGLIAFAGSAFLQCPVTLDGDAFRESLEALDVNTIPRGGTNIAAAIREAEAVFKTRTTAEKILVLITDGEDLDGAGIAAAEAAAKNRITIFTVGVGSSRGELVPVPGENGGTEFAKDERGEYVKSRLDEDTLRKIAEATGGQYQPLGPQGEGLTAIYEQGLARFSREDLSSRQAKVPLEQFHWALLAALVCLSAEQLIGNRRRQGAPGIAGGALRPAVSAATAVLVLIGGAAAIDAAPPRSAEEAYQKGDYAKAQQEYAATAATQPRQPELQFNAGSAAYKAGDFAQAATGFQHSIETGDVPVQQDAYYNLGNTQYRLGQKTEKEDPQGTIKTWEEAVKSYDAALQIKADDAAAKHNRDLVQRRLTELKRREEQKKQDQKDPSQDQKSDSKDQKGDSKDQQENKGQEEQSEDQKSAAKDQKGESKDQQKEPEDSTEASKGDKAGDKDQQGDRKDHQGGGKDNKVSEDTKNGPKEAKGDESTPGKPEQEAKGDEKQAGTKDQKADGRSEPGDDKKEQPQADARSGEGEQPKPVDPAKAPSKADAQAARGDKTEDASAAAVAADEERRQPGQMTRAEARQLLDALKGDERRAPAISAQGRAAGQPNERKTLKDW